MEIVFRILEITGLGLQVLLVFLLFGFLRQYTLLLIYALAALGTAILEIYVSNRYGNGAPLFSTVYWSDEVLLDFLRFTIVIALAYKASTGSVMGPGVRKLLIGILLAAVIVPFLMPGASTFSPRWFNRSSQMLNFGGAIMNLVLWTVLLGNKRRDPRLLLVSVGVGISVTGAAIAWGVRLLIPREHWWAPNLFLILTYLAGVAVWCWAFRPGTQVQSHVEGSVSGGV